MNKVFIINGQARAGKDLFVTNFSSFTAYPVMNISTIDPIKEAMTVLGIKPEKNDLYRKFASDLKDMCTKCYNTSYNYIMDAIEKSHHNLDHGFAFTHCRELEEIAKLKMGIIGVLNIPCETILIKRDLDHTPDNHADRDVFLYPDYDHIITNQGSLEDYKNEAKKFYNMVVGS